MSLFGRKNGPPENPAPAGKVTLPDGQCYTIGRVVDVLGDSCPRPQLMTKKALAESPSGTVIEVLVDNPTSMEAIPTIMAATDGVYLGTIKADRHWRVFVRKN
ncbi:MAG: sulfurtransferase TusA family protein [Gammaproteobacteria bacterium]|nr:sulfurtransferase TusA family protein [Gammaproteobacteria bacterium]